MQREIDKEKIALLVVESALLSISINNRRLDATYRDTSESRLAHLHNKARQRYWRRLDALDKIIVASGKQNQEIYVGKCTKNTPLGRQRALHTTMNSEIIFDIFDFDKTVTSNTIVATTVLYTAH